jgi:two-component system, OmpR family, phosphate regulon sensor histidine kinase PhoR
MRFWLRQFIYTGFITVAAVAAMALIVSSSARQALLRETERSLTREAKLVAAVMVDVPPGPDLQTRVTGLGTESSVRLTVIDTSGRVLADSRADPATMENHRLRPEVIEALREGSGTATHLSRTLGKDMMYVAYRTVIAGSRPVIVRTSLELAVAQQLTSDTNRKVLIAAAILVILAVLLSLLFAARVTRPINDLTRAARRIAAGDFAVRVNSRRRDEFGRLGITMNEMTGQIQLLLARIATEKSEFETVVRAMKEGVVELDHERRIILANEAFSRAFGIPTETSLAGKFLWELVRNPDLQSLVAGNETGREVRVQDRVFSVAGSVVSAEPERVLFVFHDITELKRLEQLKADFIANVSHELRTPLTAIKGFTETLETEVPPDQQRFLAIIARHTDRLISMVNDLLLVSRLETEGQGLELAELDLGEVIREVAQMFEKRAAEKNLQATIDVAPGAPRVRGDRFLLEQLIINLLDNAIKYTPEGGTIAIRISESEAAGGKRLAVSVADSGVGIPAEHLPRIFERFYVVDKNRSRELGGTGLGLSIAKHIVLAHSGDISVRSVVGKGTTFTVLLPA